MRKRFITLHVVLLAASALFFAPPPARSAGPEVLSAKAQRKLQTLSAQIQANPKDPSLYIARAEFWIEYLMFVRARADLDRSIAIKPTGSAYVWLAKLSLSAGNDRKVAFDYLAQARKCSAHDLQGMLKTANTYADLKEFDLAVQCDEAALKLQPGDLTIIEWRAKNLMRSGHFKEAITTTSFVLSKLPRLQKISSLKGVKEGSVESIQYERRADALKTRGLSLAALHRYAEALPDLSQALELTPNGAELLKTRAEVYLKLGKPKLAEQDLHAITGNRDFLFNNAPFAGH